MRDGLHELARQGARAARPHLVRRGSGRVLVLARARPRRGVRPDPAGGRARKHLAAAEWIEEMAGERVADHAELLAHHTTEALALSQAAGGTTDADLALRAARYLVLAGDRAFELDVGAATARYRQALDGRGRGRRGSTFARCSRRR